MAQQRSMPDGQSQTDWLTDGRTSCDNTDRATFGIARLIAKFFRNRLVYIFLLLTMLSARSRIFRCHEFVFIVTNKKLTAPQKLWFLLGQNMREKVDSKTIRERDRRTDRHRRQTTHWKCYVCFQLLQFISDLGGVLGLWFGFAFMTFIEFFEFFVDFIILTGNKLSGSC